MACSEGCLMQTTHYKAVTAVGLAQSLGCIKKSGNTWRGPCPVHGGSSFEITEKNGVVLVHCFSGCDKRSVIKELQGMKLWPKVRSRDALAYRPPREELDHARLVVLIAAADMAKGLPLADHDAVVLGKAAAVERKHRDHSRLSMLAVAAVVRMGPSYD